jgi:hypothetical protein
MAVTKCLYILPLGHYVLYIYIYHCSSIKIKTFIYIVFYTIHGTVPFTITTDGTARRRFMATAHHLFAGTEVRGDGRLAQVW